VFSDPPQERVRFECNTLKRFILHKTVITDLFDRFRNRERELKRTITI
jgi:hypothetical protein